MLSTDQIVTQFRAVGHGDVTRAFAGISAAAKTADMSVANVGTGLRLSMASAAAATVMAAAAIAGAIAGIGVASVKAAKSVEFLDAGFGTVFGSSANAAIAKLTEFSRALKREDDEVKALGLQLANMGVRPEFGTLRGIYGAAYTSAQISGKPADVAGNAQQLAQVLGKVVQLNQFGGRELRALIGQNLPGGAIKQMMAEMGLSEEGGRKLTGVEAAQGIAASLNRMYGDAVDRAANTLEGSLNQLKYTFDDLKEDIGQQLIPIAKQMVDILHTMMSNAGAIGNALASMTDFWREVVRFVWDIGMFLKTLPEILKSLMSSIPLAFSSVAKWLITKLSLGKLDYMNESAQEWSQATNPLAWLQFVRMGNNIAFETGIGKTLREMAAGFRNMGKTAAVSGDPFANITPPGVTTGENGTVSNAITEMVRRFIIGGGQFATAWARQLDLPGGGRATGTATVPIKLTPESADLQARANAAVGTDILTSILNNPAAVRLLKQKLATAP